MNWRIRRWTERSVADAEPARANVMRNILAVVLLLLPAGSAHGFACLQINGHCTRWVDGNATLRSFLGGVGAPSNGSLSFDQSSIDAANKWNAVGAAFRFSVEVVQQINEPCGVPGPQHACSNTGPVGDNPVHFADSFCGQGFGDIIELTNNCADSGTGAMINAPVFVNSNVQWDAYDGAIRVVNGRVVYDIQRVLLHEFGHVLGLDHPDAHGQTVPAIMNSHVSNLFQLQSDDIGGILSLYPNTGPPPSSGGGATNSCQLDAPSRPARGWMLLLPFVLVFVNRARALVDRLTSTTHDISSGQGDQ